MKFLVASIFCFSLPAFAGQQDIGKAKCQVYLDGKKAGGEFERMVIAVESAEDEGSIIVPSFAKFKTFNHSANFRNGGEAISSVYDLSDSPEGGESIIVIKKDKLESTLSRDRKGSAPALISKTVCEFEEPIADLKDLQKKLKEK